MHRVALISLLGLAACQPIFDSLEVNAIETLNIPTVERIGGLAYDPVEQNVYISSVTDGAVYRFPEEGGETELFLPPNDGLRTEARGIEFDIERRELWIAGGGTSLIWSYDVFGELLSENQMIQDDVILDVAVGGRDVWATVEGEARYFAIHSTDPLSWSNFDLYFQDLSPTDGPPRPTKIEAFDDDTFVFLEEETDTLRVHSFERDLDGDEILRDDYDVFAPDGLEIEGDVVFTFSIQNNAITRSRIRELPAGDFDPYDPDDVYVPPSAAVLLPLTSPEFAGPENGVFTENAMWVLNSNRDEFDLVKIPLVRE